MLKTIGTTPMYHGMEEEPAARVRPGYLLALVAVLCLGLGFYAGSASRQPHMDVLKALVAEQDLTITNQEAIIRGLSRQVIEDADRPVHDLGRPIPQKAVITEPVLAQATASWYGPGLYGNNTADGTYFTPETWCVAHKSYPFGTVLEVHYNGRTAKVPVRDRGPFTAGRDLDLSAAVAQHLGFTGVQQVKYRVLEGGSK